MSSHSPSQTGSVLLNLLRDFSDQTWSAFVDRYGPRIYQWCKGWRLQDADAADVTQQVLIKLFQKFRTFAYDPGKGRFRSWLKTVAHHVWQDYCDSRRGPGAVAAGGSEALEHLHAVPAADGLARALEEGFDLELLEAAKERVRLRVSDRDWQIFRDLTLGGHSGTAVAAERGLSVAAVYMVKSRVQRQLRDAVAALEAAAGL